MQKVNIGLNVILVILVAWLMIDRFSNNNSESSSQNKDLLNSNSVNSEVVKQNFPFINTDTIWSKYELVKEFQDKLAEEKLTLEAKHKSRIKQLEKEFLEFQEQIQNRTITQTEFEEKQKDLAQKEKDLMAYEERMQTSYLQMEKSFEDSIRKSMETYISGLENNSDYTYVLAYSSSGDILFANPEMDITKEVLDGLNTAFKTASSNKKSN